MLELSRGIEEYGIPEAISPLVFGFAGYGNVSKGAQEVFDQIPHKEITPAELVANYKALDKGHIYKVVFYEKDMVKNVTGEDFQLQDYYENPEKYDGDFEKYLPYLTVLVNCIYWDERYPRLLTKEKAKEMFSEGKTPKLKVIGDISCDIEGSIEITLKPTFPENPVFVYHPHDGTFRDGFAGEGLLVMAVDALPSELPWDSSEEFSEMLIEYVPPIARADFKVPFDELTLPDELKRALVLHRGKLTPEYRHLEKVLEEVL